MSTAFEFNAPQFVDFSKPVELDDSDGADTFFDVESEPEYSNDDKENVIIKKEIMSPNTNDANKVDGASEKQIKSQTPSNRPIYKSKTNSVKKRDLIKAVRRLSGVKKETGPLADVTEKLSKELNRLSVKGKKRAHFDGIEITIKEEKTHTMTTRMDEAVKTPRLELRTRVVKKEPVAAESRKRKSDAVGPLAPQKYYAMAEQILHFQKNTPPRFHTNRRRSSGHRKSLLRVRQSYNPRRTIALTPHLLTAKRSRPAEVPSQKDKEDQEIEEMKKLQVKAMPLNDEIFLPPKLPPRNKKPSTIQEPFNLTQVYQKPVIKPDCEPFKFSAKPVPKAILEKPMGVGPKQELPVTVPQSPAITKSARFQKPIRVAALTNQNEQLSEDVKCFGIPYSDFKVPKRTAVKPFSFESRDRQMMEKKEKKIQEILEAEKKAREFKANPLPSFVAPKEVNRSSRYSHFNCSKSSVSSLADESNVQFSFKAQSPRVLRKNPFKPILEHSHSQPLEVQLWTQRRAEERLEFEMKQFEKEQYHAIVKEAMEMEKKKKEDEEIARLRQESVHKAQPMPKYKNPPKHQSSSIALTDPRSPRFSKRTRTIPLN